MKLPMKKSRMQRLAEAVNPLERSHRNKFGLPNIDVKDVSQDTAVKAGLIAGGVVGLTAASAGISALRRAGGARGKSG
jgi:hypothetical protein